MIYALARRTIAPLARLVYRPVVEGTHHVPRTGRVILASNHLSFLDSVVIAMVAPRPVYFLTKAEYFDRRRTRWFFAAVGSVPVRRGDHRAAQAALDAAREVLLAERAFGIYPEGTRSLDGRLHRGRTGAAWLALTTGAPVVPVALGGTAALQPVGRRLPRVGRVTVRFGAPMRFADSAGDPAARRAVTDEIMNAIGALSGQQRCSTYS